MPYMLGGTSQTACLRRCSWRGLNGEEARKIDPMSIRPIVITGDPVLHNPTEPITVFDDNLAKLVEDMYDTCEAAPGVGLAGPQIGINKSIFVWMYKDQNEAPERGVAINPTLWIEPIDPCEEAWEEGCLSFPGEQYPLKRSPRAILQAVNEKNEPFEIHATGWFARILQHEFDHLTGHLYVDRLEPREAALAKATKRKNGWGKKGNTWMPGVYNLEG